MHLDPYLTLPGTARQAMEFYQSVLGGEVRVYTFGDYDPDAETPDAVMHASLDLGDGTRLMGADTMPGMAHREGDTVAVSLSGEGDLSDRFAALAEGGEVLVAYEKQMWGDTYGLLRDRFGVVWHLNSAGA